MIARSQYKMPAENTSFSPNTLQPHVHSKKKSSWKQQPATEDRTSREWVFVFYTLGPAAAAEPSRGDIRYDLWFVFIKYLHVIMYKFSRPRKWCLNVLACCFAGVRNVKNSLKEVCSLVLQGGCSNIFGRHCRWSDSERENSRNCEIERP